MVLWRVAVQRTPPVPRPTVWSATRTTAMRHWCASSAMPPNRIAAGRLARTHLIWYAGRPHSSAQHSCSRMVQWCVAVWTVLRMMPTASPAQRITAMWASFRMIVACATSAAASPAATWTTAPCCWAVRSIRRQDRSAIRSAPVRPLCSVAASRTLWRTTNARPPQPMPAACSATTRMAATTGRIHVSWAAATSAMIATSASCSRRRARQLNAQRPCIPRTWTVVILNCFPMVSWRVAAPMS